jgi:hypothetical protein
MMKSLINYFRAGLATLAVMLMLAIPGAHAATGSEGTEFYLAFQLNSGKLGELSLFIAGANDTQGTVTIKGLQYSQAFQVRANQSTTITLPKEVAIQVVDKASQLTVHVKANDKVTVYGLNRVLDTSGGFLALPVEALGLEYYALSYRGYNWSQLTVIAPFDGTRVTITPKVAMNGHAAGKAFTITLNQGDSYLLTSSGDMTGTHVLASAPVVVMAGAESAHIPTGYAYLDHIVETMTPVSTWGKSFLTVPFATRTKGDMFRVLASADNTRVSINGAVVATLKRGAFFERIVTGRSLITASEPVLVSQFALAQEYDGGAGDPLSMLIPPTEQFLDRYTFSTPDDENFPRQFVNVVVPSAEIGAIELDGVAVDATLFSPISTSGFSGGQLPVGPGSHHIRHRNNIPMGIYVYGFGDHDSYGYPGGMSFEAINPAGDAFAPGLRLVTVGDTVQGAASDSEDVDANGVLEAGEDANGNGTIDRRNEDRNGNGILDAGEDGNGNGVLDRDTGVFRIELLPDARNLRLDVVPFIPGAMAAQFTVSRIDLLQPGTGTVQVTDAAGNKSSGQVALGLVRVMKEVRVVATLPREGLDIDMASFRTAPHSVTTNGDSRVIEWRFDDFSVERSADLGFDVTLRQPLAGQKREISRSVDLYYKDETGQSFHTALDARSVEVLASRVEIAVATDKQLYAPTDGLRAQVDMKNLSINEAEVASRVSIRDAGNVLVADFGTLPAQKIAGGASSRVEAGPFALAGIYAGTYRLVVEAIGTNGSALAAASAGFAIAADDVASVAASLSTDKQSYDSTGRALVSLRVSNRSTNQALENLVVSTTVTGPDGVVRLMRTENIAQHAPGAAREFQYALPLAGFPPGRYVASLAVGAQGGIVLTTAGSAFSIVSSAENGAGMAGSITALPASAPLGDSVALSWTVINKGNVALGAVPVTLSIVNPIGEAVLAQFPATVTLAAGASHDASVNWLAEGESGGNVVAVLSAAVGGKVVTLAQTTIALASPSTKLEIGQERAGRPRVLALAAHERLPDGTMRVKAVKNLLMATGVPHVVVDSIKDFQAKMRSGVYNTFWLSGSQHQFIGTLPEEVRELVFGGAGLIVDGTDDLRNGFLNVPTGGCYRGRSKDDSSLALVDGPDFEADKPLLAKGIVHIQPCGGVAQAVFTDGHIASRGAAMVSNGYGTGRSVRFAFDLMASAADDEQWGDLFAQALKHVQPQVAIELSPGALVQIGLPISNLGHAESLRVQSALPRGVEVIDAGVDGIAAADGRSVQWRFSLAREASRQLGLDLRMPDVAGEAQVTTTVYTVRGATEQQFGPILRLPLSSIPAGDTADAALEALAAINPRNLLQRIARDAAITGVRIAMGSFRSGTRLGYELAIGSLVESAELLPQFEGEEATEARLLLARLLKEAQWRSTTAR